ncbi:MAG: hypothetical protein FRX49_06524 [Trebouxia sp. A1-2]|nr:MAG: hypothetical protein FRX49_06524 [Trebouxia sp. A1-2]
MVPAPHLWESSEDHEDDQQSSDPRDNLTKERMKRAPSFLNISMSEKFDTLATTLVSTSHARQASCVSSRPGRCCAKQALSMDSDTLYACHVQGMAAGAQQCTYAPEEYLSASPRAYNISVPLGSKLTIASAFTVSTAAGEAGGSPLEEDWDCAQHQAVAGQHGSISRKQCAIGMQNGIHGWGCAVGSIQGGWPPPRYSPARFTGRQSSMGEKKIRSAPASSSNLRLLHHHNRMPVEAFQILLLVQHPSIKVH